MTLFLILKIECLSICSRMLRKSCALLLYILVVIGIAICTTFIKLTAQHWHWKVLNRLIFRLPLAFVRLRWTARSNEICIINKCTGAGTCQREKEYATSEPGLGHRQIMIFTFFLSSSINKTRSIYWFTKKKKKKKFHRHHWLWISSISYTYFHIRLVPHSLAALIARITLQLFLEHPNTHTIIEKSFSIVLNHTRPYTRASEKKRKLLKEYTKSYLSSNVAASNKLYTITFVPFIHFATFLFSFLSSRRLPSEGNRESTVLWMRSECEYDMRGMNGWIRYYAMILIAHHRFDQSSRSCTFICGPEHSMNFILKDGFPSGKLCTLIFDSHATIPWVNRFDRAVLQCDPEIGQNCSTPKIQSHAFQM